MTSCNEPVVDIIDSAGSRLCFVSPQSLLRYIETFRTSCVPAPHERRATESHSYLFPRRVHRREWFPSNGDSVEERQRIARTRHCFAYGATT